MILTRDIIEKIVGAFDIIVEEMNEDREGSEYITGIETHGYYELSVPRGEDPTSKYLVEYEKIEHFLSTEYPDLNLSEMTAQDIKEVLREMLEVYIDAEEERVE